jgi:CHAP domain
MSLPLALARIDQIERALVPQPAATSPTASISGPSATAATAASASVAGPSFASLLGSASGTPMTTIASAEVGQAEQPPGSNDSPRIAQYRTATAGSGVGPWCAYFVSWVARQAGTPLGDHGEGFGSVDALYAWAQRTGRAVSNGPGVVPRPGDLIVFHEHVGIVEQVLPDGRIQTIEGNSSDRVSRNLHESSDALGFVRMS